MTPRQPEREAGWYAIAVAGPDTGAWKRLDDSGLVVGRDTRGHPNALRIGDSALSSNHLTLQRRNPLGQAASAADAVIVEDNNSTNGTLLEGEPVAESAATTTGSYIAGGSTTLTVVEVAPGDIAPVVPASGPAVPFQRRFREALKPLPTQLRHPAAPREESESSKRSFVSLIIPIISSVGMALMMMVVFSGRGTRQIGGIDVRWLYVAVIAIGPLFMAFEGIRRRFKEKRERRKENVDYQARFDRFTRELTEARLQERHRDRWRAAPAGLAALVAQVRHTRLWERSVTDDDFCRISVGLHDRPSSIKVEGRPDSARLPLDTQWSMVLGHSLVTDGPLAVLGDTARARALGRALLLDLAASHSPNDVRIWLITDADRGAADDWGGARWLPHTFMGDTQNSIFSTRAGRAGALAALKSIINDRQQDKQRRESPVLPVFVVAIDCAAALDPEELTDLIVDGAPVGVIGVVIDEQVTLEGTRAQLTLGAYADEATFVSETQPRANRVRSFEMTTATFDDAARALARLRPAGSTRDAPGESGLIRLVDLIDAPTDPREVSRIRERWNRGGTSRIRVGGLGDHITEIDIMKDGPHGLVGGTTRSGKTEFLKTLIVSLAVANHPDELSIVIVDFKGGVDHELSARLPHVIDLSTNHNVDSFVRTVRLIEAEMRRRQHEFKKVGAPNFDAYRAARRTRSSIPAIPRLLLIVDEFSELLSSEAGKANLSALESVTRVGGGLGVHLLLVTQNFESQLPSQIAANAGLRICFRVQEASHSKAVLDSSEAATIPKERIGRAFLRSHGGRAVEFQAARVAGPLPGKEAATAPVEVRIVPFESLPDAPPDPPIVDVPAEDTDMHAVVEVIRQAAAESGWTAPAVPWPAELPRDLGLDDLDGGSLWPVGVRDEPEWQRRSPVAFEPYGPNTLLIGATEARLGEVARAAVAAGAVRRNPEELHYYIIDTRGQGLSALKGLPHVGAVAERNEPLAMRIVRHVAAEVALRKSALSAMGLSSVHELVQVAAETMPDTVLVVNGADRLLVSAEMEPSPLLLPLTALVAETAGTGVRVLLTGSPSVAHQRLGASFGHRFVLRCSDPHDYSALGVTRALQSELDSPGRAAEIESGHLMQFALVPSAPEAPAGEVVRALGVRLTEKWKHLENSALMPTELQDLPWPLPMHSVDDPVPPDAAVHPVALCVNTDTGDLSWLDSDEDGPTFVVCGSAKSGRSSALIAGATLMAEHGWRVLGIPLSRRSPVAESFPGDIISPDEVASVADSPDPVAVFIDDVHRWDGDVEGVRALLAGPGRRAAVVAGPTEYFNGRTELLRVLPSRCALVLAPSGSLDASPFGVRRLSDEVMRDQRPGMGVLVVAGELFRAQVPYVSSSEETGRIAGRGPSPRSATGDVRTDGVASSR